MHPLFRRGTKLTEVVMRAAIEVHREKGPGLLESVYEGCLLREFERRHLSAVNQRRVHLHYKGFVRTEITAG